MSALCRSMTVHKSISVVAGYLSDLRTSVEWDPHTVACRSIGDRDEGGSPVVGSRYEHVREFAGYRAAVEFEVVDLVAGSRIVWRAKHPFADGREQFDFVGVDDAYTRVTHQIDISLRGPARLGNRMLPAVMKRIADEATVPLRHRLESLP
jgi:hypothetical protein